MPALNLVNNKINGLDSSHFNWTPGMGHIRSSFHMKCLIGPSLLRIYNKAIFNCVLLEHSLRN
jgi:hypothetical protein